MGRIWTCKVGESEPAIGFAGTADEPMRQAVEDEFKKVTGQDPDFIFSGWGGELTEGERATVEDREPDYDKVMAWDVPLSIVAKLVNRRARYKRLVDLEAGAYVLGQEQALIDRALDELLAVNEERGWFMIEAAKDEVGDGER